MKKIILIISLCVVAVCNCGCQSGNSLNEETNSTAEDTSVVDDTDDESESLEPQFYEGSGDDDPSTADIFAMDTYMNIKAYGDDAYDALKLSTEEIQHLESIFSVTNDNSEISAINDGAGNFVEVSDDTAGIIKTALEYSEKTNGALDISVYPVLREWGFTTGDYKVPDDETIATLLENTGYENIEVEGNNVKLPQDYEIDLGSVAKGYTSDKVVSILSENGVESALLNLGGNVQALGSKPDGSDWKVAVINPFDESENICAISINNKAVITSGNYERYFTADDGTKYWHIIDPETGSPARNGVVSATIVGESGVMCDALSTSLFVLGTDDAIDYWKTNGDDFEIILVTDDEEIYVSEGLTDSFENLSDMKVNIIER